MNVDERFSHTELPWRYLIENDTPKVCSTCGAYIAGYMLIEHNEWHNSMELEEHRRQPLRGF